ncbi:OmpA family protein [Roseovarius faecimaris]|uniref:OmpA family protein n=1 Tax=Roseovarius faecimaris TaxID=2494550 RepID=A0A6I6ISR7_9RHOB|nr:OmpA family protein [Roseovarius faecimaris]QGY00281.1 OmpA family protein [Roseovarius faecimaris]
MRLSSIFAIAAAFFGAAVLCLVAAQFSVTVIEDTSRQGVRDKLDAEGLPWAEVDADGLQVFLAGTAPTEATRFKALSVAGTVVDAARLIDQMLVEDSAQIAPPRFSVEILRNDSGVSLIGLVPVSTDRDALVADIRKASGDGQVSDLLEVADYPHSDTWEDALRYAVKSLKNLPRSKISVDAERVEITAMTDSPEEKRAREIELARSVPENLRLALNISAPRPVITPFTLRYVYENDLGRFDACAVDTEEARAMIMSAASGAGLIERPECVIGLGVPSPKWGQAVSLAIKALGDLGGGSVTFSDADISLEALQGTDQGAFDSVVGQLENALPDVFALHAVLPPPPDNSAPEVPEFVATLSPEGLVQIRGRVGSDVMRETADSFAKARFSSSAVHTTARVVDGLPEDWPLRVLAGLEALSYLSNGAVTVTPDELRVTGSTGRRDAGSMIAGILSDQLGEGERYDIDVTYQKELDPVLGIPTPDECEEMLAEVQRGRKITFEPGSATIDANGAAIMDDIAAILKRCGELRMEIGGHTDSQGREIMNEQLSLDRARSVLDELRARRVLTSRITAKGYGESQPIANNGTEEGREANRRIEFKLIRPKPVTEEETTLESLAQPVEEEEEGSAVVVTQTEEDSTDEQN